MHCKYCGDPVCDCERDNGDAACAMCYGGLSQEYDDVDKELANLGEGARAVISAMERDKYLGTSRLPDALEDLKRLLGEL